MKFKKTKITSILLICVFGAATARKNIGSGGPIGPGNGGNQCSDEYQAWQACINSNPSEFCVAQLNTLRACLADQQNTPTD